MKANHLLFQDLIDIDQRTGIIKLNSSRVLLISAEAIGILRKDLISALGTDRAKGFLMRYGWASGFRDGEVVSQISNWDSIRELMLSGPILHTLEGIVTVEPHELNVDKDGFYFTGFWKDSFEAEEHIRHFACSQEPVCWTLVGYASGFLTKVLGQEILVKETQCKGKGDSCCYFIAKTIAEWDEESQQDLRYYRLDNLVSEFDRVYAEIHELNRVMLLSEEFSEQLTNLMLQGRNLSFILQFIAKQICRSIIIEKCDLQEIFEYSAQDPAHMATYSQMENKRSKKENLHFNVVTFDLKADNLRLGRMVVIGTGELSKQEYSLLERAIRVCTIVMFHRRSITQSTWKIKEELFAEITECKFDDATLQRKAQDIGVNVEKISRVICIKVQMLSYLENIINYVEFIYPNLDIFLIKNCVVLLLPRNAQKENVDLKNQIGRLEECIHKRFGEVGIFVGAGREVTSILTLGKSFMDACQITNFLDKTHPKGTISGTYEQFESIMLFLQSVNHEELILFCQRTIGRIIEYDELNHSGLLSTLRVFLMNNGNLHKSAIGLHLSVAGLRYRLQKIEDLSSIKLNDGSDCFKCNLAIQIYFSLRMVNKQFVFKN